MTFHQLPLEQIAQGRLAILEWMRLESPDSMTTEDWTEYRHLKSQYQHIHHESREKKEYHRITFRRIREGNDYFMLEGEI